ncbi:hypothetical protein DEO72_LG11g1657 [Vigna unguiculata]|uniref:Uncharacterized protein n=1 Tax=Vigna unguiculata TaxID=3917 RepID=A0A4D6NPP8_VIGUN|nr:hypothetical protein DEO72_LG11g1657 [Vigna unguiculata]
MPELDRSRTQLQRQSTSSIVLASATHNNSSDEQTSLAPPLQRASTIYAPATIIFIKPVQISSQTPSSFTNATAARLHTSYCISAPSVRASLHLFEPSIFSRTHLHQRIHHGSTCRNHEAATHMQQQPSRRKTRTTVTSSEERPYSSIAPVGTLIWEREGTATWHPVIAQSKSNLVKHSKAGQTVKDWSNERSLTINIDIFRCLCKIGLQD